MENATKALLIAGGILLGILILSIGVYVVLQFSNLSESFDDKIEQDRILAFNNKFLVYAKDITPQEMVSLINLVNEENKNNPELKIEVINATNGRSYLNMGENEKISLMKNANAITPMFKYVTTNYNASTGYVKKMIFK